MFESMAWGKLKHDKGGRLKQCFNLPHMRHNGNVDQIPHCCIPRYLLLLDLSLLLVINEGFLKFRPSLLSI